MNDTTSPAPASAATELYAEANRINAKLSSRYDAALAAKGRQVANQLLEQVKAGVADMPGFVERVDRSELFSLHESAQVEKTEKQMKLLYVRAMDLLETISQSESRAKR